MLKAVPVPDDISPRNGKRAIYDHAAYLREHCRTLDATKRTLDQFEIQRQFTECTLRAHLDIIEKMILDVVEYKSHLKGIDGIKFRDLLSCLRKARTELGMALGLLKKDSEPPKRYFTLLNRAISILEEYLNKNYKR